MGIERELKLALAPSQHDDIARFFDERTGAGKPIALANVYFDTPDCALAKAKSALRLRRTPEQWLQTYKTLGKSVAGLSNRQEWELPVKGEALEIDALIEACDDEAARDALQHAAPELIALFKTDFKRIVWDMEREGSQIEMALDRGKIIADVDGETRHAEISELELKSGDVGALSMLSAEMRGAFPELTPEDLSKAERGYLLRTRGEDDDEA
ncbi:Adenylate cyclase [Candidatus Burkholderia verschuerenii]|uniref:Adenylate cyclase n=1 Tax=Candidatus Burkholderia verschuerenii TaxID=242163 RepID=A0A0L0M8A7_9BURK|nr:CYTH domain-containing protein [Candidatus Burkholderia verschuerenii]KND58922.1 Adenylate cyclase [Candidatus Burkholderia verschuerenii]